MLLLLLFIQARGALENLKKRVGAALSEACRRIKWRAMPNLCGKLPPDTDTIN